MNRKGMGVWQENIAHNLEGRLYVRISHNEGINTYEYSIIYKIT